LALVFVSAFSFAAFEVTELITQVNAVKNRSQYDL